MSFLEFWWGYPRRTAKFQARTAYDKALKVATHEEIMLGLQRYVIERRGEPQKFTKHPATWLNHGCWLDYETAEVPASVVAQPKIFKCSDCLQITIGNQCGYCRRMHVVEQARSALHSDIAEDDRERRSGDHLHLDRFSGGG